MKSVLVRLQVQVVGLARQQRHAAAKKLKEAVVGNHVRRTARSHAVQKKPRQAAVENPSRVVRVKRRQVAVANPNRVLVVVREQSQRRNKLQILTAFSD